MVFLWCSCGFPMGPLWISYAFPIASLCFTYGPPMLSLWFSYGSYMSRFLCSNKKNIRTKKGDPAPGLGGLGPGLGWARAWPRAGQAAGRGLSNYKPSTGFIRVCASADSHAPNSETPNGFG